MGEVVSAQVAAGNEVPDRGDTICRCSAKSSGDMDTKQCNPGSFATPVLQAANECGPGLPVDPDGVVLTAKGIAANGAPDYHGDGCGTTGRARCAY
jgi:hypothetical protein